MRSSYRAFIVLIIILFLGCSRQQTLNENPLDYVKRVVAYKEGPEGLRIYFIPADHSGAMTTSHGEVKIKIKEIYHYPRPRSDSEMPIYTGKFTFTKDDFFRTRVGEGAFNREAILCSLGRLPYSEFPLKPKSMHGKVQIELVPPDGKILTGETEVIF